MNAKIIFAIITSIVSVFLLILVIWIAGAIGILFAAIIIVAAGLKFASYLGWFCLPSAAKGLSTGAIVTGLVAISIIGIANRWPKSVPDTSIDVAADQASTKIIWSMSKKITAPENSWSDPEPWPYGLSKIVPAEGEKVELLSNGRYYLLDSYEQIDLGGLSGHFQVRGIKKNVTVFLYTAR